MCLAIFSIVISSMRCLWPARRLHVTILGISTDIEAIGVPKSLLQQQSLNIEAPYNTPLAKPYLVFSPLHFTSYLISMHPNTGHPSPTQAYTRIKYAQKPSKVAVQYVNQTQVSNMPRSPRPPLEAPISYSSLALHHVIVTNVPSTSPGVTPVIKITLNRPAKLNAFTDLMRYDLERVYELVDVDPRVKAVVLTGAGESFCTGADLEIGFPGVRDERNELKRPKDPRDADHRDG